MDIQDYINAQRANLESISKLPNFYKIGGLTNELYELAVTLVPKSSPIHFGQLLLICHKSFLSALILIGQAQPDDEGPITRRAIEAARLALAIKTNPENARKWVAYEKRMGRWEARDRDEKPKLLTPKLSLPNSHPILNELEKQLGILSDSSVHLTPEFFGSQHWVRSGTKVELRYFMSDQRKIECNLITLAGVHACILRIFNECLNGPFFSDDRWFRVWGQLENIGKPLAEAFKPGERLDEV